MQFMSRNMHTFHYSLYVVVIKQNTVIDFTHDIHDYLFRTKEISGAMNASVSILLSKSHGYIKNEGMIRMKQSITKLYTYFIGHTVCCILKAALVNITLASKAARCQPQLPAAGHPGCGNIGYLSGTLELKSQEISFVRNSFRVFYIHCESLRSDTAVRYELFGRLKAILCMDKISWGVMFRWLGECPII